MSSPPEQTQSHPIEKFLATALLRMQIFIFDTHSRDTRRKAKQQILVKTMWSGAHLTTEDKASETMRRSNFTKNQVSTKYCLLKYIEPKLKTSAFIFGENKLPLARQEMC